MGGSPLHSNFVAAIYTEMPIDTCRREPSVSLTGGERNTKMRQTSKEGAPTGTEEALAVSKIDDESSQLSREPEKAPTQEVSSEEPPYTILRNGEKIFTIILASFAAFISPVSSSIYFPALNPLAKDLNVTPSAINVSITTYIVVQGIAPTFIGSISDKNGRRPAFLICCAIYR